MALEIKKESFSCSSLFTRSKCEQAVNLEINLPDYCSDIKRILRCIVTAGISNVSVSGENVNLSGTVVTRLVYVGENEKTDCCEHTSALSCSTRINNMPENPLFTTKIKTDYINCRALSQRRVSVSGNIGAVVCVYRENKTEIPCHIDGMSMECKKEKKTVSDLICQAEKTFDLSETIALENEKEDIGKIIRSDCRVKIDSKKAVADKLLIKGELLCEILYTDSEKNNLVKVSHSMPISQILGISGITDKCDIRLLLSPSQFIVSAKNDSSGRCRLLEIGARISSFVRCCSEKEISFITDCYSTVYEMEEEYGKAEFYNCIFSQEKEITGETVVDFSQEDIGEIKDMWSSNAECSPTVKDSQVQGECNFILHGIYTDGKNNYHYGEKNISVNVNIPLKGKTENAGSDCYATVTSLDWSKAEGGKVKIRVTVLLDCCVFVRDEKKILRNVQISDKEKEQKYPALCLYYAGKGEKIWDIAKHYNTTEELIKTENGIKADATEKEIAIMVPCV